MLISKSQVKALLAFASKDATRPHLCGVYLDGSQAVAIDGHTLLALELEGEPCTGLVPRAWFEQLGKVLGRDPTELVVADGAVSCSALPPVALSSATFPSWRQVIPAPYLGRPAEPVGLCCAYLARLELVTRALGCDGMALESAGALDPVVARAPGAVAVVMPMRI